MFADLAFQCGVFEFRFLLMSSSAFFDTAKFVAMLAPSYLWLGFLAERFEKKLLSMNVFGASIGALKRFNLFLSLIVHIANVMVAGYLTNESRDRMEFTEYAYQFAYFGIQISALLAVVCGCIHLLRWRVANRVSRIRSPNRVAVGSQES